MLLNAIDAGIPNNGIIITVLPYVFVMDWIVSHPN